MLILVFGICLIALPLAVQGLFGLFDLILIQQSGQHLETVLLSAYSCMDSDSLAVGQPKLDSPLMIKTIRQRFDGCLPGYLKNRLNMIGLNVEEKDLLPDPNHWMGQDQPQFLPVVTLRAEYIDHQGKQIALSKTIELLID